MYLRGRQYNLYHAEGHCPVAEDLFLFAGTAMSENPRLSFHSRIVAPDQPHVYWERKLINTFSISLLSFTLLSLSPLHFSSGF